ncbi:MAG: NAD(P)/FAD-dependent oxidoreductase [Rikenellaceae bacterium]|nr:NAD(P)/FAD-dependent oxidoreductase [Rikenellaceae bacterium]
MTRSAVIIGGGLGGLFTGAILAKEGFEVTVIEKNATVGGGLQSFTRFGEVFDTGMHVIGGMREGGNIRRICEYLGIFDKVQIKDVDDEVIDLLYFAEDKQTYRISQGKQRFVDSLAESFPDQRENLKRYVDALYGIVGELDMFFLKPSTDYIQAHGDDFIIAANEFIAKYISNERLRSVLAYMNPLYAGRKNMTPAYIHALISVLYIDGPSRFAGGSQLFANLLRDLIIECGGEVVVGDGVEHIATSEREIVSVTTRKGRTFTADYYIGAIHPCSLVKLLDDKSALPKAYRTRLEDIPNSYSAFTLNIKLKPNTFRYLNHSRYYMTRYDDVWSFDRSDRPWPLGFLYMTPPEIEQGEFSTKMIVTAPMTWDRVKEWEDTTFGHRTKEYQAWKEECTEKLLCCMEELYPDFRDYIENINTASPLTIRDYYAVKEGAMCGYSKDCNNMVLSQVPIVTKIKNLLLTGQNCNIHGFCGVPLTAINTCEAILGRNYIIDKINESER